MSGSETVTMQLGRILIAWGLFWTAGAAAEPAPGGDGKESPGGVSLGDRDPAALAGQDLTEVPLEMLGEIQVETVYGASRHAEKESEAPSSVTVITADDIRKFGYRTMADIFRAIRGTYTTYDRNYEYLGVRGFGIPGDYNTRVLILVDGNRQNDAIFDQGSIGHEFILDVDLIDRVEFIRGPGSALYGSNAFFGVINVITKGAAAVGGPEIAASAGSFASYEGRGSFARVLPNGLELLFSATGYDSEGQDLYYREFDDPATGSGWSRGNDGETAGQFFGKVRYKDLTLAGAYSRRDKEVPTASFETVFGDHREETMDSRWYGDLRFDHAFDEGLEVMARAFLDGYSYRGTYPFEGDDGGGPYRYLNRDIAEGRWWGVETQVSKVLVERLRLTGGGEFRQNFRQDQENYDVDPRQVYLDDARDSWVGALFAQGELEVIDPLRLDAGVRWDHYETFGDTVNPRVGVMGKPFPKTTLKLLYGRAFRAPNVYEMYYSDGGDATLANPDLDPETIDTYEAVLDQTIGKRLRLGLDFFHYDIDDLISQVRDPGGYLVFRNVDSARANGVEVEVEGKWASGLRGRASYTYVRAEDAETGRILVNSPEHLAKLDLIVPIVAEKLFGGFEAQYVGPRKTFSGGTADGYIVANLTIFGREFLPGLEFSASIYNLFDARHEDPAGLEHEEDTIPGDGISFRIKLTYRF